MKENKLLGGSIRRTIDKTYDVLASMNSDTQFRTRVQESTSRLSPGSIFQDNNIGSFQYKSGCGFSENFDLVAKMALGNINQAKHKNLVKIYCFLVMDYSIDRKLWQ